MRASSASTSPGGINSTVGRSIKSLAGKAKKSDAPCVRYVDAVWLGAVAAAGLFLERCSKMRKARIKPNPLFLVPEAGIEPACAFLARGILSPLRLPISPLRQQGPQWRDSSIGI
jgi:hypothetical protein